MRKYGVYVCFGLLQSCRFGYDLIEQSDGGHVIIISGNDASSQVHINASIDTAQGTGGASYLDVTVPPDTALNDSPLDTTLLDQVVAQDDVHDATIDPPVDIVDGTTGSINIMDPSAVILTGDTVLANNELELTTVTFQAGAAYIPTPYYIRQGTSFKISFSFCVYAPIDLGADGFTIVFQNDPRGITAVGTRGGNLGYTGIVPSVAVEFDTLTSPGDPAPTTISILSNGDVQTHIAWAVPPFKINDGNLHFAWITYDEPSKVIAAYVSNVNTQPSTPIVQTSIDLLAIVGDKAYIGFTAGTGSSANVHAIRSLSIEYTY